MTDKDKREMAALVSETIKIVVNGKIDRLHELVNEEREENRRHREELQPLLDLLRGARVTQKVIVWATSIIIAIGSTFVLVKGLFIK